LQAEEIYSEAERLRARSRYAEALRAFRRAKSLFARAGDGEGEFICLMAMGDMLRMAGRYKEAEKSYREAHDITYELRSPALRAEAETGIGLSLRGRGDWKGALSHFRKAKRHFRKTGDTEGLAFVLWAEAGAWRYRGMPGKSIALLKEALKTGRGLSSPELEGYCLNALGGASRVAGLRHLSLRYYRKANEIFSATKDRFGLAYSFCGMGNAERMYGRYQNAHDYFRKALRVYDRIGDIVSSAYTLWSIGQTYLMEGRLLMAERSFNRADERFRQTGDTRGRAYHLLGLSQVYALRGERKAALKLLERTLRITEKGNYLLENCHARTLHDWLSGKKSILTEGGPACYNRLGIRLKFTGLPFNIP